MLNIETLSFDCYGTLIDWESGLRNAIKNIMDMKHKRVDLDAIMLKWLEMDYILVQQNYKPYKEIMKVALKHAMEYVGIEYSDVDGEMLVNSVKSWMPFQDVAPALKDLRKKYKLIIISNIDNDLLEYSIKNIGVSFDGIVTAEDAKSYKPSKMIFEYAIEKLKLRNDKTLHISFSPAYDLETARSLGFRTAWVNRKRLSTTTRYDIVCKDLLELRDILMKGGSIG